MGVCNLTLATACWAVWLVGLQGGPPPCPGLATGMAAWILDSVLGAAQFHPTANNQGCGGTQRRSPALHAAPAVCCDGRHGISCGLAAAGGEARGSCRGGDRTPLTRMGRLSWPARIHRRKDEPVSGPKKRAAGWRPVCTHWRAGNQLLVNGTTRISTRRLAARPASVLLSATG